MASHDVTCKFILYCDVAISYFSWLYPFCDCELLEMRAVSLTMIGPSNFGGNVVHACAGRAFVIVFLFLKFDNSQHFQAIPSLLVPQVWGP